MAAVRLALTGLYINDRSSTAGTNGTGPARVGTARIDAVAAQGEGLMNELQELSYSECEALLRAGVAGRIAVVDDTGPHIVPVNYSIVDGAIVVLTA